MSHASHVCPISTWNANCATTILCLLKISVTSTRSDVKLLLEQTLHQELTKRVMWSLMKKRKSWLHSTETYCDKACSTTKKEYYITENFRVRFPPYVFWASPPSFCLFSLRVKKKISHYLQRHIVWINKFLKEALCHSLNYKAIELWSSMERR